MAALGGLALLAWPLGWGAPLTWMYAERRLQRTVGAMGGRTFPWGVPPAPLAQILGGTRYGVDLHGRPLGDRGLKALVEGAGEPIQTLDLSDAGVTDLGLESLASLTHVTMVKLGNSDPKLVPDPARPRNAITDVGLSGLASLGELQALHLSGAAITDAGLARLRELPAMRELALDRTPIAGSGLSGWASIGLLMMVNLDDTLFSDSALASFRGAKSLHDLNLRRTRVAGPGLAHLAGLPLLENLALDGCPLGRDALKFLGGAPLVELSLADVPLVPADLAPLADPGCLPRLRKINFRRTGIVEADVAAIRKARPGLKILLVEPPMVLDPRGFYLPGPD